MKNYSKINDAKDLITKEYLESNTAGKKSVGTNAEVFNDYENSIALGEYSSVHGKSTNKYDAIERPEKIYYKALPNTVVALKKDLIVECGDYIPAPFNFDYLIIEKSGDVNIRLEFKDPETQQYAGEKYLESGKWYPSDYPEEETAHINVEQYGPEGSWKIQAVTEGGVELYDFESLQFSADSTDSLGELDKVYTYKDVWGNTRYTLWQEHHPDWKGTDEGYLLQDPLSYYDEPGVYQLRFRKDYMQTENYKQLFSGNPYSDLDVYIAGRSYYVNGTDDGGYINIPAADEDGVSIVTVRDDSYEQDDDSSNDDLEVIRSTYQLRIVAKDIVDVYKYIEGTPVEELVKEASSEDPIYKTILYEALKNGNTLFALAEGNSATVFGENSITNGNGSFAAGISALALRNYSVSIGRNTESRGPGAVSFGSGSKATGIYSFAVGEANIASGYASIALGDHNTATNYNCFAGGYQSKATGNTSFAFGLNTQANGKRSIALGDNAKANGPTSIAIGSYLEANGKDSITVGYNNKANGDASIALGINNTAEKNAVTIGEANTASERAFALGRGNKISGLNGAIGLGNINTVYANNGAAAIGERNTVGFDPILEENKDRQQTTSAFAMGRTCLAEGDAAVALGESAKAIGKASFAVGYNAEALATQSIALGRWTKAGGNYQTVLGRANKVIEDSSAVLIVGSGMHPDNENGSRSNAMVVYQDGNVSISGIPYDTTHVTTKYYVDSEIKYNKTLLSNQINTTKTSLENLINNKAYRTIFNNQLSGKTDFDTESFVSGQGSVAVGRNHSVDGDWGSVAIGNQCWVIGKNGSVVIGQKSGVESESAYAIGLECKSYNIGAIAIGQLSEAHGKASFAAGYHANAETNGSIAIGRWTKAAGDYQTVLGRANEPVSNFNAVLVVGTGMQDDERSNGMIVWKDGRVEIGADPTNAMDVVTKQYLDSKLGDINTTLLNIIAQQEAIIAKQNELLGGNS